MTARPLRRARLLGRIYFLAQAVAGAVWWWCVFTVPPVRSATLGSLDPVAMALADIPLFVVASALAAVPWRPAVWTTTVWTAIVAAGMAGFATLTGQAGWGALMMAAAAGGSIAAALLILLGRIPSELLITGPFAFRGAPPGPAAALRRRTTAQIVAFWGTFLVIIPVLISFIEWRWGLRIPLPPVAAASVAVSGGMLLIAASWLGIRSAVSMTVHGEGTPLPLGGAGSRGAVRRGLPRLP